MLFNAGRKEEGNRTSKASGTLRPGVLSPHDYLMIISLELKTMPSYWRKVRRQRGEKRCSAEGHHRIGTDGIRAGW